jgi:hypothetical protein
MPGDIVTISMLGDAGGNSPGPFATLDARDFSIAGRWEAEPGDLEFTYDFWYQPRPSSASPSPAPSSASQGQRHMGAVTVIDVVNEPLEGWPLEGGVPGLITDLVLSLDDKDLFFSNWLRGDLRHYDVSDPRDPRRVSQVWLGGLLGRDEGHPKGERPTSGGPQMLQNSLDGERVYVSNSLYSTWDNQFYPECAAG